MAHYLLWLNDFGRINDSILIGSSLHRLLVDTIDILKNDCHPRITNRPNQLRTSFPAILNSNIVLLETPDIDYDECDRYYCTINSIIIN